MADDADKATDAAGTPPGTAAKDAGTQPAAEGVRARSDQNEWTASDRRGPLDEAGAEAEAGAQDASRPPPNGPPRPTPDLADPGSATVAPSTEPADTGPVATEPVATEPVATEPVATEPVATEPVAAEPVAAEPPRRSVLPVVAALVIGAIIGAASAAIVYKSSDQGASQRDVNALGSRLDALEKRPDPQLVLDQLKSDVAKAAAQKPAPPAVPAAPAFDPGPLQQKVDGLASDIDGLKKQDADHSLGDKVAALGDSIAALKTQGADVKGLDDKVAGLAAAIDGLKKEDQSAQAGIAGLQSGQKTLEGKTGAPALAVAADSLVVAIAQGRPYATQVDALASLGADPAKIAVLRENADKGVPSAQALAAQFAPLADPVIATASQAPANASLGDRLKSGFFGMVQVRRSDATLGDDVASRVARIEADLAHDDIAGAYDTWTGLPAAAKAKSDAWGALAKTQVAAMGAARTLQQQAIAALGGKKS